MCGYIPGGVTISFGRVTLALVKPDSHQTTIQIPLSLCIQQQQDTEIDVGDDETGKGWEL